MMKGPETKHKVLVRFNEKEYSLVKENAAMCRLPVRSYFRKLIMGILPAEMPGDDYHAFHNGLRKIGINLMQITGKAQTLKMRESSAMWSAGKGFRNHCARILRLMLRFDKP